MKTYWSKDEGIKVKKINGDDIWNLDDTFLIIICESLKYFRANHTGFPPFAENDDEWNNFKRLSTRSTTLIKKTNSTRYSTKHLKPLRKCFSPCGYNNFVHQLYKWWTMRGQKEKAWTTPHYILYLTMLF